MEPHRRQPSGPWEGLTGGCGQLIAMLVGTADARQIPSRLAEARDEECRHDDRDEEENGEDAELPVRDRGWMARFRTEHLVTCLGCCPDATLAPGYQEQIMQTSQIVLRHSARGPRPTRAARVLAKSTVTSNEGIVRA